MCYVLYIAGAAPLPEIEKQDFSQIDPEQPDWASRPVFSVEALDASTEVVRQKFAEPFVCYAGSYGGCGCGFNEFLIRDWEEPGEPDESQLAATRSREDLRAYIEAHGVTTLYGCWSGDEALPPVAHRTIELAALTDWGFEFPERVVMAIGR